MPAVHHLVAEGSSNRESLSRQLANRIADSVTGQFKQIKPEAAEVRQLLTGGSNLKDRDSNKTTIICRK